MKSYIAIDLKSFYASVECVERGLNPLTAKLVVADESRTDKTICLAVSPALKALGIPGRARLYEVKQKARDFIIARPRMAYYISYSTRIYNIDSSRNHKNTGNWTNDSFIIGYISVLFTTLCYQINKKPKAELSTFLFYI